MSATGRSDVRLKDDFYQTPAWCIQALWPRLAAFDSCLDPCAGEGAVLHELHELSSLASHPTYYGIEINESHARACANKGYGCAVGDALYARNMWRTPFFQKPYELICTNPPYSLALEFVKKALASGAKEVAMLMRLNFLGGGKRAQFWRENPCDVLVLPKRPSFAIFMSCKKNQLRSVAGCGWHASYPPTETILPKGCPSCGNPTLTKSTSDATEYAWFLWRSIADGRGGCQRAQGHWDILRP